MDAASLIRQARDDAELQQAELAARAGVSQPMIARYEAGKRSPTIATLLQLLSACGKDLEVRLVRLGAATDALIEASIRLSPTERMEQHDYWAVPVLEAMARERLEFVVVGRTAALLHGAPVNPQSTEVEVVDTAENLERLRRALERKHMHLLEDTGELWAMPAPHLLPTFGRTMTLKSVNTSIRLNLATSEELAARPSVAIVVGEATVRVAPFIDALVAVDDPAIAERMALLVGAVQGGPTPAGT